MKALSIKQPFAELILQERKKIEIKKWNTDFRGEFLINSSKKSDEKAMKKFMFKKLPCGFILGKAELINVKKYKNSKEFIKDKKLHLVNETFSNYGFILEDVKKIKPIPVKDMLGFWDCDLK